MSAVALRKKSEKNVKKLPKVIPRKDFPQHYNFILAKCSSKFITM